MIYSFVFYLVLSLSFVIARSGINLNNKSKLTYNVQILFTFLLITLFLGLRYNLGRDFPGHWRDFNYLDYNDFGYMQRYNFEYGYLYVVKIAKILPFGAQGIFLLTSLIAIFLLFNIYRHYPKFLPIGLICFFMCGPYEFNINGIRQGISVLAFLNACLYLKETIPWKKGFFFYFIWILFGCLFHTSCVVFLIFYPLRFVKINKPIRIVIIVAPILAYIFNITGISNLLYDFSTVETGYRFYDSYLSGDKTDYFKIASDGLNLGQFVIFSISMIPLFYSKQIAEQYKDIRCYILLYALGMTISSLYIGNMMVTRFAYYFTFTMLLLYPAFTSIINKTKYGKDGYKGSLLFIFWIWFFVLYFYNLPSFFKLHVWPEASVFGISIN